MGLIKLNDILQPCVKKDWAVGAFDTPNLDITQAIVDGAVAEQAPVIFMVLPAVVCEDQWPALVALIKRKWNDGSCRQASSWITARPSGRCNAPSTWAFRA